MVPYTVAAVLLVAVVVSGKPGKPRELWSQGLYQGDILLRDPDDRNAIVDDRLKWPNGVVPYILDSSVNHIRNIITDAMKQYHQSTCIRFVPRTTERDYVKIFSGDGCYSYMGHTGGEQPLSLGAGCEYVGTSVHEMGHAIGFDHEQNRSDRDNYIVIYWENISEDGEGQFDKLESYQNRIITPFDYNGIMLYGNYAFSVWPGKLKTMEDINKVHVLEEPYDKPGMTKSDIQRVNTLYNCK